jgi:hypothetical protein
MNRQPLVALTQAHRIALGIDQHHVDWQLKWPPVGSTSV